MWLRWLWENLHKELPPQSTSPHAHRREALPLRLGGLRLEVCTFGRAHTALQETHRPPAISVSEMWPGLLKVRPPCSPYEETLMRLGDGWRLHKKEHMLARTLNKLVTYSFWKTIICLQAVVKRQDKLWCSRQKQHYSFKSLEFLLKTDPVFARRAGDLKGPLSQGCKLLWKGPNWNLSYLTDKTWRTRCQRLFNWKCIFVRETRSNRQTSPEALNQQHANVGSVINTLSKILY